MLSIGGEGKLISAPPQQKSWLRMWVDGVTSNVKIVQTVKHIYTKALPLHKQNMELRAYDRIVCGSCGSWWNDGNDSAQTTSDCSKFLTGNQRNNSLDNVWGFIFYALCSKIMVKML